MNNGHKNEVVMKRREYTKEFKLEAIALAETMGSTLKAAEQLDVPKTNLHSWVTNKNKILNKPITPKVSISVEELAELKSLRKEVLHLKKVNHILKAAAAFFSQDHV